MSNENYQICSRSTALYYFQGSIDQCENWVNENHDGKLPSWMEILPYDEKRKLHDPSVSTGEELPESTSDQQSELRSPILTISESAVAPQAQFDIFIIEPTEEDLKTRRPNIYSIHPDNIIIRENWNPRGEHELNDIVAMVDMILSSGKKEDNVWVEMGFISTPIRVKPEQEDRITESGVKRTVNTGKWILVHGERRVRAAQEIWNMIRCGDLPYDIWHNFRIPATPMPEESSEMDELLENYTGNNTGIPLSTLREAQLIHRLSQGIINKDGEHVKLSYKQIGEKIGKSYQHVSNMLDLLSGPQSVIDMVESGRLSPTLAVKIIRDKRDDDEIDRTIEQAASVAQKEGTDRITDSHVSKVNDKRNSVQILKDVLREIEQDKYALPRNKQPIYKFCQDLVKGKLVRQDIVLMLTNQLSLEEVERHLDQDVI